MTTPEIIEITAILGVTVSIVLLVWLLIADDKARIKRRAIERELHYAEEKIVELEFEIATRPSVDVESLKKQVTHLNTIGIKREGEIRRLKGELKKLKRNDNKKQ